MNKDKNGNRIPCKLSYQHYIKHRNPEKLFTLKRKKERTKIGQPDIMFRKIVDIKIGGEFTGRCISVSHPNGLYLTNDFINCLSFETLF